MEGDADAQASEGTRGGNTHEANLGLFHRCIVRPRQAILNLRLACGPRRTSSDVGTAPW